MSSVASFKSYSRKQFLDELVQFNLSIGVTVQDTVLGGQKLDYFQIFLWIIENGGYDIVSRDKTWKRCAEQFNFPKTCTNSSFVVKQAYNRYLHSFEMVKVWGKPIEPFVQSSPPMGTTTAAPSPSISTPTIMKRRVTLPNATTPSANNISPAQPISLGTNKPHILMKQQNPYMINPDDDGRDEKYLHGGNQSRILLALESNLENEIEWALLRLTRISYSCPQSFFIQLVPGLVEALMALLEPFFSALKLNTGFENFTTTLRKRGSKTFPALDANVHNFFNMTRQQETEFENVCRVLHILRNFSFIVANAQCFSQMHNLISMVAKGCALPPCSYYIQIRQDCYVILENISPNIICRGVNDFFINCLREAVFENDRSVILGSVNSLRALCANRANHPVFLQIEQDSPENEKVVRKHSSQRFLRRLVELLLVYTDQELVCGVLDYLFEFSTLGPEACKKIANTTLPEVGCSVLFLLRFLNYDYRGPKALLDGVLADSLAADTTLPDRSVTPFSHRKSDLDVSVLDGTPLKRRGVHMEATMSPEAKKHKPADSAATLDIVGDAIGGGVATNDYVVKPSAVLQTHFPLSTLQKSRPTPAKNSKPQVVQSELCGIPLTCLLLLRNIARGVGGDAARIFCSVESDLAVLGCDSRYSKFVTEILECVSEGGEDGSEGRGDQDNITTTATTPGATPIPNK